MLLLSNASATDNTNEEDFIPGTNMLRQREMRSLSGENLSLLYYFRFGKDRVPSDCEKCYVNGLKAEDGILAVNPKLKKLVTDKQSNALKTLKDLTLF